MRTKREIGLIIGQGFVHLSLSCLTAGLSAPSLVAMAQGISEGLLTNRLSELSFKRMGHFLRGVRAEDLGHSLTALFYLAIDQALEHTAQS